LNLNPKIQTRKRLIIYNTTNGIVTLRKHDNAIHSNVLKFFENELNCLLREEEKKPSKKRLNISLTPYLVFFCKKTFQERRCATKILFGKFESFNCQKPYSFIVCGE
jgi:hypothetical protein